MVGGGCYLRGRSEEEGQLVSDVLALVDQLEGGVGRNVLEGEDARHQLLQHRIGQRPDGA